MKVSYKVSGVTGFNVLFDEEGGLNVLEVFKPSFHENVFTAPGFGAVSQSITPEGNTIVTLPLTFKIIYDKVGNADARQQALASIRAMRILKGLVLHIQVIQGGETQYYPNGTVESYEANITGAAVDHSFVFKTQDVTITAPIT